MHARLLLAGADLVAEAGVANKRLELAAAGLADGVLAGLLVEDGGTADCEKEGEKRRRRLDNEDMWKRERS